jgi:2-methylcitrate dehydratase
MDATTEILSSYSCGLTYEDLGPEVIHQVKRTVVDTLGCAAGGYRSEPGEVARRLAGSITSNSPARILGTHQYSSPDMAGFANGVMIRYLDCNDSYFSPGGGHPSDMIAAALALAGPTASGGKSVITAIVLAYEVFGRLSDQVLTTGLGWDQGMFSIIGATCAAGKILGLDQEQLGQAISLAVTPNLPLGVTRTGELSMWKGCATASATRAGIFAAQLAELGMTGPGEPFEGRRGLWEQSVGQPVHITPFPKAGNGGQDEEETRFRIMNTTFKSYPSQIHTQAPAGLAVELHPQVSVGEIESVRVFSYHGGVSTPDTEPEKWDPKTRETADHSIPYLVAAGLLEGEVTAATFTREKLRDSDLRRLMSKMTLEEDPEFSARYPEEYNCRIEVTRTTGATVSASTRNPKGHRLNPMTDSEVETKFRGLTRGILGSEKADRVLELAWTLDRQPDMEELFDSLVI